MQLSPELQSRASDGYGMLIGSLWWSRPYYPTRYERATLLAATLPQWAIATGITAAWVWTGFGSPEPWSILRPGKPEISPMDRQHWGARAINPQHTVTSISGLSLLCPQDTTLEVLLRGGPSDSGAAQIVMLTTETSEELREQLRARRTTSLQRAQAQQLLARVDLLRATYPDITRYTS
jgi:hypothetical protein